MPIIPQKPLHSANSGSSDTNTHTNTNSGLDVLTSELLRSPLLFLGGEMFPATPRAENSSKYLLSPAKTPSSGHLLLQKGPSVHNSVAVLTRGSTPQHHATASAIGSLATALGLSESMIASLPFYDLSNYSRLLNTLNLLQSNASINNADPSEQRPGFPQMTSAAQLSEQLNQVPHRFSQFIMDQNAPWAEDAALSSNMGGPNIALGDHSREISLLMGSQATIFSTRPGEGLERGNSTRNSRHTLPLNRRRAIRCKQGSKTYRLRLLLRKLAVKIRRKLGTVRQFFVRPKRATSKVKLALAQPFLKRGRSGRNRAGVSRIASVRTTQISAPLANPGLESQRGARKVDNLTEELKTQAGAGGVPGKIPGHDENEGIAIDRQWNEGSVILEGSVAPPPPPPHTLDLFQHTFARRHEKTMFQGAWKQYLAHVLALRIKLRQEVHLFQLLLAHQPIPSVFGVVPMQNLQTLQTQLQTQLQAPVHLSTKPSTKWLESGGDIKSHRASIVLGKDSYTESEPGSVLLRTASLAPTVPSQSPSQFTTSPTKLKPSKSASVDILKDRHPGLESEVEEDDDGDDIDDSLSSSSDEQIEKLQQVLNRRSMLGEMLDYDSDEFGSLASSMFSRDSLVVSVHESPQSTDIRSPSISDPHLVKRYGTVRRRATDRSSHYGSSYGSSVYPDTSSMDIKLMSRSRGYGDLQAVARAGE